MMEVKGITIGKVNICKVNLPSKQPVQSGSQRQHCNTDVIIISHNYGHFLAEAIASVRAQIARPAEIVVVDDSSTDNTREVAERLGVRYIRVDVLNPLRARQAGFQATSSKFICFLDADDVMLPTYLQTGLAAFDEQTGIIYSDFQYFGDESDYRVLDFSRPLIYRHNMCHAGCLVRRAALDTSDAFSQSLADIMHHDWSLFRKLIETGWETRKNPTPYLYRRHSTSLTVNIEARQLADRSFFLRANLKYETITLVIPLSGRSTWTDQSAWLTRQTWPHHQTRLLLFDTSGDVSFHQQVRQWMATPTLCDYTDVRHVVTSVGRRGLAEEDRHIPQVKRDVQLVMAKIYSRIRTLTAGNGEYLWVVEDDIVPPNNAAERLLQSMDRDVASVSGTYESRYTPGLVAHAQGNRIPLSTGGGSGVERIGGNGFGCVMLRLSIIANHMFTHCGPTGDYDHNFYDWLQRQHRRCNRVLLDWDCRCRHISALPPPG